MVRAQASWRLPRDDSPIHSDSRWSTVSTDRLSGVGPRSALQTSRMKNLLILLPSVLFLSVQPALHANEVRIYAGTIKHDFFYYIANLPQSQGVYVVQEPGTSKLAFITYD